MSEYFKIDYNQDGWPIVTMDNTDLSRKEVLRLLNSMTQKIEQLKSKNQALEVAIRDLKGCMAMTEVKVEGYVEDSQAEREQLKKENEEFRADLDYWVGQYGCDCNHPSCRICKDSKESLSLVNREPLTKEK